MPSDTKSQHRSSRQVAPSPALMLRILAGESLPIEGEGGAPPAAPVTFEADRPARFWLGPLIQRTRRRRWPNKVILRELDIEVATASESRSIAWSDIGRVASDVESNRKSIVLYGRDGQMIAKILNVFAEFERMRRMIREQVEGKGS